MALDHTPAEEPLPRGQRPGALLRFGLPAFARRQVKPPGRATLTITGRVHRPCQIELADLIEGLARPTTIAPLHCVATWTANGHTWSGPKFKDVLARLDHLVQPDPRAHWLVVTGIDGYRRSIHLDDATADSVLLADHLDGVPLSVGHGAPARLVAPTLYGYSWVKHLATIDYQRRRDRGSAGWKAHRRGRVHLEERSACAPGWLSRRIWAVLLPVARRAYRSRPLDLDAAVTDDRILRSGGLLESGSRPAS